MKAVLICESSGATMDQVMAVYPRHKAVVDPFILEGLVKSFAIHEWNDAMLPG